MTFKLMIQHLKTFAKYVMEELKRDLYLANANISFARSVLFKISTIELKAIFPMS